MIYFGAKVEAKGIFLGSRGEGNGKPVLHVECLHMPLESVSTSSFIGPLCLKGLALGNLLTLGGRGGTDVDHRALVFP